MPHKTAIDSVQAIINIYKKDIDRTLIHANLKLTAEQCLLNLQNFQEFAFEIREAGKKAHKSKVEGKLDDL